MAVALLDAATMASSSQKGLHSFFARKNDIVSPQPPDVSPLSTGDGSIRTGDAKDDDVQDPARMEVSSAKSKKPNGDTGRSKQKTLQDIIAPRNRMQQQTQFIGDDASGSDLNPDRRKRRRTSRASSADVGAGGEVVDISGVSIGTSDGEGNCSPQVLVPRSDPIEEPEPTNKTRSNEKVDSAPCATPKKLLRLNADGKFSSPPSKLAKQRDLSSGAQDSKRRGRPRKIRQADEGTQHHLHVKVAYGKDKAQRLVLGEHITKILKGDARVSPAQAPHKKPTSDRSAKVTHPFFLGKERPQEQVSAARLHTPRKASAVTPGKLRSQNAWIRAQEDDETSAKFSSELLKDRLMVRVPGATEAPFPSKGQAHVCAPEENQASHRNTTEKRTTGFSRRRMKHAALPFPTDESILADYVARLHPEEEPMLRPDGFYEPCSRLQVPERILMPGQEALERTARELRTSTDRDQDELQQTDTVQRAHPALVRLSRAVATTLSAFDETRGEAQMWTQKYAPLNAEEVLQSGKETLALRDWLKRLRVQAVGGHTTDQEKHKVSKTKDKPSKRRRRNGDMDDFIVDSDEEVRDMSELNSAQGFCSDSMENKRAPKSIIEVVHDGTKLSNVVLLSGGSGYGKTASAHAVATELGFKIFEISPSERRSGKDVLDKVGNMTENHLVKHHGSETEVPSAEEPARLEEAFQRDLQSGRQGNLNTFFQPRTHDKHKAKPIKDRADIPKVLAAVQEAVKKPSKDQQQSLILLEEVDILFRDDKDFWTTVLKLIVTSKRPCIMTCNDEDLVPLAIMPLHAVLRFVATPESLAVDYMLLLAAAEGHLLHRDAVASLYSLKAHDLRASITELQYWCQMGVGDPKAGLGWIYQRWPPGSDVDKQGRKLRVTSSSTYTAGMGIFPAFNAYGLENLLMWSWDHLHLEPYTALGWTSKPSNTEHGVQTSGTQEKQQALRQFCDLVEALSAADTFCSIGLPQTTPLDPTQPKISEKSRLQYRDNITLLQTDEYMDYLDMSRQLLVSSTVSAYNAFQPSILEESIDFARLTSTLRRSDNDRSMTRRDLACFDAISVPKESNSGSGVGLTQSVFDGVVNNIALDLAPYVRSIVQYDMALEQQRQRLDLLMSDGRKAKRVRTTRAARSALEGGQRSTTRREKWFTNNLDMEAVLATGGKDWPRVAAIPYGEASRDGTEDTEPPASSAEGF